jgi:hypothetical protein
MPKLVVDARWRLAALGVSQSAHFLAIYCLRVYVVLLIAAEGATQRDTAWHLVSGLFMLPSVILVPLYGAVGNSLPKRGVLVGSAAYCLAVVALFAWWGRVWLGCVAGVALGSALYTPTRHALLPAAARDTHLPLPRVISAIETTAVLSIVAGMVLGGVLMPVTWGQGTAALGFSEGWATGLEGRGLTVPVAVILGLSILSLLAAVPVRFVSDVHRSEAPWDALRGFFADASRLMAFAPSRFGLVAVCILRGLVTASAGALIADFLAAREANLKLGATNFADQYQTLIVIAVLTMLGAAAGSFLAGLVGDRSRVLGLVPLGATGMVLTLGWIALSPSRPAWLCVLVGVCGGLVNVPLISMLPGQRSGGRAGQRHGHPEHSGVRSHDGHVAAHGGVGRGTSSHGGGPTLVRRRPQRAKRRRCLAYLGRTDDGVTYRSPAPPPRPTPIADDGSISQACEPLPAIQSTLRSKSPE